MTIYRLGGDRLGADRLRGNRLGASLSRRSALLLTLVAFGAGCTVPSYHLPAGFSSSYQRQLYGMDPVAGGPTDQGLASIENRRGVFFPMSVYRDSAMLAEDTKEKESMDPLFLGSDPISPQKPVKRPNPDAQ